MSATAAPPSVANFWTIDLVARALAELGFGANPLGGDRLAGVVTDTRTLRGGELFVALAGERFDAHDFLADAVKGGAAALVVSRPEAAAGLGVPVFVVNDTLEALGALARYRRRAWNQTVVGVAGSNGKTTTKDLIRAALGASMTVHATTGNLNNLIGVPLTIFALPDEAAAAVIEMGVNVPGEMERLRGIAEPDIGVITSIGEEHLEGLGSMEGVLREEAASLDGVQVAVVPASQPEIAEAATGRARRVVSAGLDAGDLAASSWGMEPDGRGWIEIDGVTVRPPVRGAHNLRNTMLAIAVARECGVATAVAAEGIAAMPVPSMRSAWENVGEAVLINDAYNANPPSMKAAIDLLDQAGRGARRQRVAVLGTMGELGTHATRLHEEIARHAMAAELDLVAAIGQMADALRVVAPGDRRVVIGSDVTDLWEALRPRLEPNAAILVKGSRSVRLERLVPLITAWAARNS